MADREIKIIDGEYVGKPPRPVRRILDVLVGVCLITSPLWAMLSYIRITAVTAGLGLAFVIVQRLINKGEPGTVKRRVSMGLRIFAAVLLALTVVLVFDLDRGMKGLYSLKRSLFCFGNGVESSQLEFMPDSIPSGSESFSMRFYPSSREGTDSVKIHFTATEDGVKELRETALQKGGVLEEKDSFVHKKLRVYCEKLGMSFKGCEVYSLGKAERQCPAYLIDPETGFCVIYW